MDKRKHGSIHVPCREGWITKATLLVKDQPPDIPNLVTILSIGLLSFVDFSVPLQGLISLITQIKAGLQQLNKIRLSQLISKSRSPTEEKDGVKLNCYLLTLTNTLQSNHKYTL